MCIDHLPPAGSLFRGEWFLDLEAGVPYYQDILGQDFNQDEILDIFRPVILGIEDVQELLVLTATENTQTRIATITFQTRTTFGDTDLSTEEI